MKDTKKGLSMLRKSFAVLALLAGSTIAANAADAKAGEDVFKRCAVCHSSDKGGGDGGLFVMLTADDQIDLRIPGQTYTFGTLAAAQATGDYAALCAHGRRVLRLHFTSGLPGGFHTLFRFLGSCSESLGR